MANTKYYIGNHELVSEKLKGSIFLGKWDTKFTYSFENFFHPFVGRLIEELNRRSLKGLLDPDLHEGLSNEVQNLQPPDTFFTYFKDIYQKPSTGTSENDDLTDVEGFPKEIDVSVQGPYSNYNWELLFHIPLTIAVHLSKSQRFAEAQRWFHFIFDPTSNDTDNPVPKRFWRFIAFRNPDISITIDNILKLLSIPENAQDALQQAILQDYKAILRNPFKPHAVARTRHIAYQYNVVMKYLDNLIAWGDNLFQQDTIESINEATQRYVLAANILGQRPQRIPPRGTVSAKSFRDLKSKGLGPIGNAMVEMEGQFPFNLAVTGTDIQWEDIEEGTSTLFGIGQALYFCLPRNDNFLEYWDNVADRLYKIRHCMNIAGIVRPLALFDPPLDPAMMVKASAAGIDVSSIVNGQNQPIGPIRSLTMIQKALELCNEVRGLGGSLLSAFEKGDAEHLALIRQRHEVKIQEMAQEVRFLQWKSAQETTKSLITSRNTALERLHYYQRLLGLPTDQNAPDTITLDRRELSEENFDEAYGTLVGQYEKELTLQSLPTLKLSGNTSPSQQSGASGKGMLYLNNNEDRELNDLLATATTQRAVASDLSTIASVLTFIPDFDAKLAFWGLGAGSRIFGGAKMSDALKIVAGVLSNEAAKNQDKATMASKTASYERRADEWILQYNLAAHELMQNGRQILSSLLAEQIAHHEYMNIQKQIENAREVDQFLHDKFTNEDLHLWMQGEILRLYYEYYRFAFDTARKAERTMKQELMRPEVDAQDFVKFNYWDGGRKGLLSGEALHLDVKRMEMAYYENNRRELELVKHVSLRQLNPVALLALKSTGTCQVTIPEWLYDLDCPGHYMRRIKSVSMTIPSVVGPFTSVNCTLSLLRSTLRKSPMTKDGEYARQGTEDDRFVNYFGTIQSIVTSGAQNDSGLFEANLRDERFLPFESAGAESTWKLDLPADYPAFDYGTISDIIIHIRYTARQGVDLSKVKNALVDMLQQADQAGLALLFSLRHDFSTEWAAYLDSTGNFVAKIRRNYFPYFAQGKTISICGAELYGSDVSKHHPVGDQDTWDSWTNSLGDKAKQEFPVSISPSQVLTRSAKAPVFLVMRYTLF